jgi:hypothetical protein
MDRCTELRVVRVFYSSLVNRIILYHNTLQLALNFSFRHEVSRPSMQYIVVMRASVEMRSKIA